MAGRHLATVGIGDRSGRLPVELPGGEQQRVAIVRALACEPPASVVTTAAGPKVRRSWPIWA